MLKNKIRDLNSFGKVMNLYYNSPEELNSIIRKNEISKIIEKKEHEGMIKRYHNDYKSVNESNKISKGLMKESKKK